MKKQYYIVRDFDKDEPVSEVYRSHDIDSAIEERNRRIRSYPEVRCEVFKIEETETMI